MLFGVVDKVSPIPFEILTKSKFFRIITFGAINVDLTRDICQTGDQTTKRSGKQAIRLSNNQAIRQSLRQ